MLIFFFCCMLLAFPKAALCEYEGGKPTRKIGRVTAAYELQPSGEFISQEVSSEAYVGLAKLGDNVISMKLHGAYRNTEEDLDGFFPNNLFDVGAAFYLDHKRYFAEAGVRSAGDEPFTDFEVMDFYARGAYAFYQSGSHSLEAGLAYSSRGIINDVPFAPLFLYRYTGKDLFALVGIPFGIVRWSFVDDWSLNVRYFPISNLKTAVTHELTDDLSLSAEFFIEANRWFVSRDLDTWEPEDREFIFERRVVGMRAEYDLTDDLGLDIFGGYAFGNEFRIETEDGERGQEDVIAAVLTKIGLSFAF